MKNNSSSFVKASAFSIALFSMCILSSWQVRAQRTSKEKKEVKIRHKKIAQRHSADSVWEKDLKITDTSAARIISSIENINNTLNDFNDINVFVKIKM